jgi:hypothetical protein
MKVGKSHAWESIENPGKTGTMRTLWMKKYKSEENEDISKKTVNSKNQKCEIKHTSSDKNKNDTNSKKKGDKDDATEPSITTIDENKATKENLKNIRRKEENKKEKTATREYNRKDIIGTLPIRLTPEERIKSILLKKFEETQLYKQRYKKKPEIKENSFYNYYSPIMSEYDEEPPTKKQVFEEDDDSSENKTLSKEEIEIIFSQGNDETMENVEAEVIDEVEVVKVTNSNVFIEVVDKKKKGMMSLKNVVKKSNVDEYDFDIEGKKELERDYNTIHEDISRIWLPRKLPEEYEREDTPIVATKYTMPVTIRMFQAKGGRKNFHKQRILVALMKILQTVQPETYISPLVDDGTVKDLVIPEEVPLDDRLFRKYMEKAVTGSRMLFVGKVVIKSNTMLHQFKYQEIVLDYLRDECMNIDINTLDCVAPAPVGFFEHLIARNETIDLYAKRLYDLLPSKAPPFQLNVQTIKARHDRTRVLMLNCKPNDVIIMQEIMKKLHAEEKVEFMTWKMWNPMIDEKKETVILSLNKHTGESRSHVLNGFIDEDIEVPMIIEEKSNDCNNNKNEKLEKITVNEFLMNIKAGDGTNLFEFVYPTTLGCKEFIVEWHHNEEAKEFLEVGIGELARHMNENSRKLVFQDPDQAFMDSCGPAWEPYYRMKDIASTVTHSTKNKRIRIENEDKANSKFKSYAEIVAIQNIQPKAPPTMTTMTSPTILTTVTTMHKPIANNFSKKSVESPSNNTTTTAISSITNNDGDVIKQMRLEMEELRNEIRSKPQLSMELIDEQIENQGKRLQQEITGTLTKRIAEESKETNKVFVECFKELREEIEVDKVKNSKIQNDVNNNLQMILALLGKTSLQDNKQDQDMVEASSRADYASNGRMTKQGEYSMKD